MQIFMCFMCMCLVFKYLDICCKVRVTVHEGKKVIIRHTYAHNFSQFAGALICKVLIGLYILCERLVLSPLKSSLREPLPCDALIIGNNVLCARMREGLQVRTVFCALFIFSVIVISCPVDLLSAEPEPHLCSHIADCLTVGNENYSNGNFGEAAEYYKEAIGYGANGGDVFYNLGNALYRSEQIGLAIWAFRMALVEIPRDPDVRANLKLARDKAIDKIEVSQNIGRVVGLSSLLWLRDHFSVYELQRAALLLYCIFWALFMVQRVKPTNVSRIALILLFFSFASLCSVLFCARQGQDGMAVWALTPSSQSIKPAVIVANNNDKSVNVYSGDSEHFQVIFVLHDGAEVESPEYRGDWVAILLPKGQRGWVKREDIIEIS